MPARHRLTPVARKLRRNQTDTERLLWQHLRGRRLCGVKFRRQQPLGPYVVDFVSFGRKVVVELDGGQHALASEEDARRDEWLKAQGYRVLRFWNNEVLENLEGVLETIARALEGEPPSPRPSPPRGGERE